MSRPALQIAFLSAQADRRSCALSPVQRRFLHRLAHACGATAVEWNFPYDATTPPWRPLPLWRESLNVARQFLAARRATFASRHREAVLRLLAGAEATVFLAGSCGLELLRRLDLPPAAFTSFRYVAFGAVARGRMPAPGLIVLGRRDWIARGRGPAPDAWVDCGHLDYLENAEFAARCAAFVRARHQANRLEHAAAL